MKFYNYKSSEKNECMIYNKKNMQKALKTLKGHKLMILTYILANQDSYNIDINT
ncbi:MAG: hypothetical protein HFH60_02690 [Lachnospiraceae bacterium]|nr:hypothetical protein [Lachnospiraceae bacterium]